MRDEVEVRVELADAVDGEIEAWLSSAPSTRYVHLEVGTPSMFGVRHEITRTRLCREGVWCGEEGVLKESQI